AITNKFAWLSIFVTLIGQVLPSLSESVPATQYVSSEIWFLSAVLSIVLGSGLIYVVHPLNETQGKSKINCVQEGVQDGPDKKEL
ncbi:MAG TPA: hypothetical protein VJ742_01205, partial [Nitrososphaera sp.]|nr:hypothetical protein [Nitrososphaera sp.]